MAQLVSASIRHIPLGNGASILLSEFDGIWYRDAKGNDHRVGMARDTHGGCYARADLRDGTSLRVESDNPVNAARALYEAMIDLFVHDTPNRPEWLVIARKEAGKR